MPLNPLTFFPDVPTMSKKDKHQKHKDKKRSEKLPRMPSRKLDVTEREVIASGADAQGRTSSDVPVPVPVPDPEDMRDQSPDEESTTVVASTKHSREEDSDQEGSRRRKKKIAKVLAGMEAANAAQQSAKVHGLDHYHHQSRLLPRVISPFMNPFEVLEFGLTYDLDNNPDMDHLYSDSESESDTHTDSDSEYSLEKQERAQRNAARARTRELIFQYNGILDVLPDLRTDAKYFDEDELITLTDFVRTRMNAARCDDSGRIRDLVITYMIAKIPAPQRGCGVPSLLAKHERGWQNKHTARLLCPQRLLSDFDADWQSFVDRVLTNKRPIKGGDFASFLYDQDLANPNDDDAGLLRSPYFLMCFKALWTGPSSVHLENGRHHRTAGKPPIACKYKLYKVSPRMIAYTAVLVRCELSSLSEWSTTDIAGFDGTNLYDTIIQLFADPVDDWRNDTLRWWNQRVFGNMQASSISMAPKEKTTADRIRAKRKASRRAAQKGSSPPATSGTPASAPASS
ncbi:hypothetical protein BN946_scf184935.g1 [Trametes cinnabarina]|uniref:Uncharacterized protein n=1 Tax=Pycnoporus cinnabarinus TaxID=5643 RepID=A0A060SM48_PYCCI|nr:hypothetical protein BN946_scf184935.g1 [Trametes cinnabarina]